MKFEVKWDLDSKSLNNQIVISNMTMNEVDAFRIFIKEALRLSTIIDNFNIEELSLKTLIDNQFARSRINTK